MSKMPVKFQNYFRLQSLTGRLPSKTEFFLIQSPFGKAISCGRTQVPQLREQAVSLQSLNQPATCPRATLIQFTIHLSFNMFLLPCVNQVYNIQITNKKHFSVYDVFYSQFYHRHVSISIAAVFRIMILLEEHNCINVVSCDVITP